MSKKPTIEQMLEYLGINITPEMKVVLQTLKKAEEVEENKLAESLKVRINDVRKLMYELANRGYVKYTKKKSEDKQWWYVYLWHLDLSAIRRDWLVKKTRELEEKNLLLREEAKNVFRCSNCRARFTLEDALEYSYICPKCGGMLVEIHRRSNIAQLEREIKALESEIKRFNKGSA